VLINRIQKGKLLRLIHTNVKLSLVASSFENSFCEDYVTEKFFKVLDFDLIPIVLGGNIYSKMAPAKSYIDVQQFETPKHLAQYLQYLDGNIKAYAEYFEWKRYFKVNWWSKIFCQLCKSLNDATMPQKTYTNLTEWWVKESHCITKGNFPWSRKNHSVISSEFSVNEQ